METAALYGYQAVVITVSDRCFRQERSDRSGPAVAALLEAHGAAVERVLVPDGRPQIERALRTAASAAALVVTTGGTGLAPRDVTPEATLAVCDRLVPGLAEEMRRRGLETTPFSPLSRGVCGVYGSSLLLNLPGSPAGAEDSLRAVLHLLPHALALLAGNAEHKEEPRRA
jgi:molybdopterin adenylyltransferase